MKSKGLLLASALGLGLGLAMLVAMSPPAERAYAWPVTPSPGGQRPAGPAFVEPGGTGGWCLQNDPCGSIQYAINSSEPGNGDTIYVAEGTYVGASITAVITVTKNVTIYGGWDGSPSGTVVRDPDQHVTILDGLNDRRVVYITGTVAPRLEGLTLQRGDAAGLGGDPVIVGGDFGGAVYANSASPVITNCRIVSSNAGFGAGLALYYGAPTVANSAIVSNTASQMIGANLRGVGGGMLLYHSVATIEGSLLARNVASGTQSYDGGGGLYLDGSPALIQDNTLIDNHAYPFGGGLFAYDSAATLHGNTIRDNRASAFGGGGFILLSPIAVESSCFINNYASTQGGALDMWGCAPFTMTNNVFALNHTLGNAPAVCVQGYWFGSIFQSSQGTLEHNTFSINHAQYPWMVHVGNGATTPSTTLAFTNTIFDQPGGLFVDTTGSVTLDTTLWDPSLQAGAAITGPGAYVSSTNYYSAPILIDPTCHLAPNSPAIDLGTDAGVTTDVDGEHRPNGPRPDIGADEFYCYGLTDVTIAGPTAGVSGTTTTFTATVSPPTATHPITYVWQATAQMPMTHVTYSGITDTASFTWTTCDTEYVTATATNCGGSGVATHTVTISPAPSRGVALTAPVAAREGAIGTSVTYTLRVTNTGNAADSIDLSTSGNSWTVTLSSPGLGLGAGQGADLEAYVQLPAVTASDGVTDSATIRATSANDSSATRGVTLTTTARWLRLYLPLVLRNS